MQQASVTLASLCVMSLCLAAPALAAPCPPDSVQVGAICVDTHEASVWEIPDVPKNKGLINKVLRGRADLGDLTSATAVANGVVQRGATADDYGVGCPDTGNGCGDHNYRITWDDFNVGFSADSADSKWFYFSAGPFVGNDGIETTSNKGLRVVASGVNAETGQPAFTLGLGQEDENGGLPGGLDHVKWLVFANHLATTGYLVSMRCQVASWLVRPGSKLAPMATMDTHSATTLSMPMMISGCPRSA